MHVDAYYLSNPHKVRSQTGYVFTCEGTMISWHSQKQPLIVTFSNDAEVIALHKVSRECVWIRSVAQHIQATCGLPVEDNVACVVQMKEECIKSD